MIGLGVKKKKGLKPVVYAINTGLCVYAIWNKMETLIVQESGHFVIVFFYLKGDLSFDYCFKWSSTIFSCYLVDSYRNRPISETPVSHNRLQH